MQTTKNITDLQDYPAIKKLASALHRMDANHHGAAVMIGAGFSRSAARHVSGNQRVPLWTNFTRKLADELYGSDKALTFADPLRVAEEYRAYFGQGALNDRIRFEIDDSAWLTGPLYDSLLSLPWAEMLTTNWDTLLERAAQSVHSPFYTTVTKASDLAWAQSPRIVKLHGTIGVTDAFIAAQEDYRTYPERYAPFVNFARQVFIENELCLLGFSGEDPNFLQWAGWVRDHLADHARKIYLVGALNLSAARRKQLELTNVAPVDLYPAVAHITEPDARHEAAIKLFLETMKGEVASRPKPQDWVPSLLSAKEIDPADHGRIYRDAKFGAKLLASQLPVMQHDRETYPGWLVCPPSLRSQLSRQISTPFPTPAIVEELDRETREKLLYEVAWRLSHSFEYIAPWLSDALFDVAKRDRPYALNERQQAEIALLLLNNTRWLVPSGEDEQKVVDGRIDELLDILRNRAFSVRDCEAEIKYHQALTARDRLDYETLEGLADSIKGEDPVWMLRKAALLSEIDRGNDARELLAEAYGILREHHRRDRQSIPIMSRLLWAHWLLVAVSRGSIHDESEELSAFVDANYRKWKCDPWTWLEALDRDVDNRRERELQRRNPIEPQFEQGRYRDHSNDSGDDARSDHFFVFDGIGRICGIPLRMEGENFGVSMLSGHAEELLRHGGTSSEITDCTLVIRSASSEDSKAIKEVFGRIQIARCSDETIHILVDRVLEAVKFWQHAGVRIGKKSTNRTGRLRVLIEILARLAVRVSVERAKDLFEFAVSLGKQPEMQHPWLADSQRSLLHNAMKSVPSPRQGELLQAAMLFPLASELEDSNPYNWPNIVVKNPGNRPVALWLDERIDQLIGLVRDINGGVNHAALERLLPLSGRTNFLTESERVKLAKAIWGAENEISVFPKTNFYPHVFLALPSLDKNRVEAAVRAILYDHGPEILDATQATQNVRPSQDFNTAMALYEGLANAAKDPEASMYPTAEQAVRLFDRLVAWRPVEDEERNGEWVRSERRAIVSSIGRALAYSIAPALDTDAKTFARFLALQEFYTDVVGAHTALPAFVQFVNVNAGMEHEVGKMIAISLRDRTSDRVSYALFAIKKWLELEGSDESQELRILTSKVIGAIESGRLIEFQQLLWLALELCEVERLTEEQRLILAEVVPEVFHAMDYSNVDPHGREAVTASTIRAGCAGLAKLLVTQIDENKPLLDVLNEAEKDPLPEVRFSLLNRI